MVVETAGVDQGEAKQRRPPATVPVTCEDVDVATDSECKSHRSPVGLLRSLVNRVWRRLEDVASISILFASWVFGYIYATEELLQPIDSVAVRAWSVLCHILFALAILSWVGVVIHGPGRVSHHKGEGTQLPSCVIAAMDVGRFSQERPFKSEDGFCSACERWKPVLANHCSICGQCSLWMDHHCNFAGQCVGFRNLRCFVQMLLYTQMLCFVYVPLLLRRLLQLALFMDPLASFPLAATARFLGFGLSWVLLLRFVRGMTKMVLGKVCAGWPSQVLLLKFQSAFDHAQALEKELAKRQSASDSSPFLLELQRTLKRLRRQFGGIRGIFKANNLVRSFAGLFGAPLSWRWLLPLLPGGSGDPLRPTVFDRDACDAWAALSSLLQECHALRDAELQAQHQATGLWDERIGTWLAEAEKQLRPPQATLMPEQVGVCHVAMKPMAASIV